MTMHCAACEDGGCHMCGYGANKLDSKQYEMSNIEKALEVADCIEQLPVDKPIPPVQAQTIVTLAKAYREQDGKIEDLKNKMAHIIANDVQLIARINELEAITSCHYNGDCSKRIASLEGALRLQPCERFHDNVGDFPASPTGMRDCENTGSDPCPPCAARIALSGGSQ